MSEDQGEKQARAVAVLLARVPDTPPESPASTQWVESDRNRTEPHGLYR